MRVLWWSCGVDVNPNSSRKVTLGIQDRWPPNDRADLRLNVEDAGRAKEEEENGN
jgi:hypothetical protein